VTERRLPGASRTLVPPTRTPARADFEGRVATLRGRRVAVATASVVREDVVAWSDLVEDAGALWVDVVQERDWWVFVILGFEPVEVRRWPAGAVWVTGPEVDLPSVPSPR
jgi:hypothetical protein